jgi:hypothetical protein
MRRGMSKIIIALLALLFIFIGFLLFWILVLSFALLIFSRKGKKGVAPHPEIKGS